MLESLILVKCGEFHYTSDNQFGFKSGHSTEFCIYTLQEYIEFLQKTKYNSFCDISRCK